MIAWNTTRTVRKAGAVGMMALLAWGCTDDNATVQQEVFLPEVANSVPAGQTDGVTGYDLNGELGGVFPTPETAKTVLINSSNGITGSWTFPTAYKVGTGLINPFMRIQKNGTEEGFNSDAKNILDTKSGTRSLPLNWVPVLESKKTAGYTRQFILDANENNSGTDWQISMDRFEVFVCKGAANTFSTRSQYRNADGTAAANCYKVYDLGKQIAPGDPTKWMVGWASDAGTKGSGNSLDYDIEINNVAFDAALAALGFPVGSCAYNGVTATPCGAWVIVDVIMGAYGTGWEADATFEEFSTIKQPWVEVTKTATPTFTRNYLWRIAKSANPSSHTLFEGQSGTSQYTVTVTPAGTEDSGWNVSGGIAIVNPSDLAVSITGVTDQLSNGQNIPVSCGVTFPYQLAGGGTLNCTYSYNFTTNPGAGTLTNNVTVTVDGLSVATGQSQPFAFTAPTTENNKTVDVTDLFKAQLTQLGQAVYGANPTVFQYSRQFTCDQDQGEHPNVATIEQTGQNAQASVTVNCLDLNVSKTANTALERTYKWNITKTATPATWNLFDGDQGTTAYTVTATPNGYDDAKRMVSGQITVNNPNGVPVYLQSVTDAMTGPVNAAVDCGVSFPYTLAAGGTLQCSYSASVSDASDRTNTATVSAKPTSTGTAKNFTGQAAVSFAGVTLTEVNKTVDVTDSWKGALGQATWGTTATEFKYDRTFACAADKGTHRNIATITQTAQADTADVTVNCYKLAVTKTASTQWTRTWDWRITKTLDPGKFLPGTYDSNTNTATIGEGNSLEVFWNVGLDATSTDSGFKVSGGIKVSNAGNPIAATINGVSDLITAGDIAATVDCGVTYPYDLAAGASLDCTYSADLPNATTRTNTAKATLQNKAYTSALVASNNGTSDWTGTAPVTFSATPTSEIDECVDVADLLEKAGAPAGSKNLGTYCASQTLPKTFQVSFMFGPNDIVVECGDSKFDNTASFVTNDTAAKGSATSSINITVECIVGCTLTQGYWKTHNDSFAGGAPSDPTWDLLGGGLAENTPFFLSGQSWFQVFWTAPKGNAYYNLAHQFMAAKLNTLAGANTPAEVASALADAEALFGSYTPAQIAALKGNAGATLRNQFITLAGVLGSFNEGLTGPGHCTENVTSGS